MRTPQILAVALALTACASAGGSIFPEAGEPIAAIAAAERLINDAQQAGADSLAAEPLAAARTHLAEARAATGNRAALKGRQAQAAATFARAEAERKVAERAQMQAQEALRALPPGSAR